MPVTTPKFRDFYAILGITKTATSEEVKGAFRTLARQWHPDRRRKGDCLDEATSSPGHTKFAEIEEAYRFLMDPALRAWYDKFPAVGHGGRRSRASTTDDLRRRDDDVKEFYVDFIRHIKAKSEADIKEAQYSCAKKDGRDELKSDPAKYATSVKKATKDLPSVPLNVFTMSHSGEEFPNKALSTSISSLDKAKVKMEGKIDPLNLKGAESIPLNKAETAFTKNYSNESLELPTGSTSASSPPESDFASPNFMPQTSSPSEESEPHTNTNVAQDLIQIPPEDNNSVTSLKSKNATIYDDSDNETSPQRLGKRLETTTDATSGAPSEWMFELPLSLEELYEGTSHRYRVTRNLLSGKKKNILIDINVLPGWKAGTKIRFPGAGNERRNNPPQDIVFVVQELSHPKFKREGSNLVTDISIPLEDALAGNLEISLRGLDGKVIEITTPAAIIKPGEEFIIRGSGMPMRRGGQCIGEGDLIIRWEVVFPEMLTPQQIKEMRRILNPGTARN